MVPHDFPLQTALLGTQVGELRLQVRRRLPEHLRAKSGVIGEAAHLLDHDPFDLGGGKRSGRTRRASALIAREQVLQRYRLPPRPVNECTLACSQAG